LSPGNTRIWLNIPYERKVDRLSDFRHDTYRHHISEAVETAWPRGFLLRAWHCRGPRYDSFGYIPASAKPDENVISSINVWTAMADRYTISADLLA
jgi:hypothetical protein